MATLIDNPSYSMNEVYEIQQTDKLEGAATGASFGGIGISNQPQQQLANRTAFLYGRQNTNIGNIATLQGQVNVLIEDHGVAVFSSSGTFTVPANVTRLTRVRLWGGGGGGGGSTTSSGYVYTGSGGGGGGYAEYCSMSVTPGDQLAVTIGAGGAAGPNNTGQSGYAGGESTFNGMSATGGGGGSGWFTSAAAGGAGGSGHGGTFNAGGAQGSAGAPFAGTVGGTGGGATAGGDGGGSSTGLPDTGTVPGGGGAGAGSGNSYPGAVGAAGLCIIEW